MKSLSGFLMVSDISKLFKSLERIESVHEWNGGKIYDIAQLINFQLGIFHDDDKSGKAWHGGRKEHENNVHVSE